MAKQHDDWLAKLGAAGQKLPAKETKVSIDHKTVAVRKFPDGLGLAGGYDHQLGEHHINLQCGPVPLLLSLRAKVSFEGEGKATGLQRGERTFEVAAGVGVAGTVTFGPGKHVEHFTVQAFVGATLGAKATLRAVHTESVGWDVYPLTIVVYGKGTIGALLEFEADDKHREFKVEAKIDELELLVIECSSWKSGSFGSIKAREGKDVERIRQTLREPARLLEEAARRIIESETGQKVAAKTGEVLDGVKDVTGVDIGQAAADGVALAVGDKTKAERDAEFNAALAAEAAISREFDALMARLRIGPGQALVKFRTAEEWNRLVAEVSADRHRITNGQPPQRRWIGMADQLARLVLERREQLALHQSRQQGQLTRDQAMKEIEQAFAQADRSRNHISQFVPPDKNDLVHKAFNAGDQKFRKGVALRESAAAREGEDCVAVARQAIAAFTECRTFMQACNQEIKRRKAAQVATPA